MTRTSLDALYRTPSWITDLIVGALILLFTAAAAQSAAVGRVDAEAQGLRGMASVAEADTPAPALIFSEPVAGYGIISPFGLRQLPWEEQARLHAGVDIAAPFGTPVAAVADGVVTRAGQDGAYGRYVEIRHAGGLVSFYAHLGAVEAKTGTPVLRGETVGRIGSTGSSTGSHLHLEIRAPDRRPLDPAAFLGRQFAALDALPLKTAGRIPREVRTAYVSFIPVAKQALMAERQQADAAAEAPLQPRAVAEAPAAPPAAKLPVAPVVPPPAPKPAGDFLDPDAPIATAASA